MTTRIFFPFVVVFLALANPPVVVPHTSSITPGPPEIDDPVSCRSAKDYDEADIEWYALKHLSSFAPPPADEPQKQMLLLMGGSGSGKTTLVRKLRETSPFFREHFVLHGLDEYLVYIPEYQKMLASGDFKEGFADSCMPVCIRIAVRAGEEIRKRGLSLIYEETGKSLDRVLKRVLPPFAEANYKISLAFTAIDETVAIARAQKRFADTGRHADVPYIKSTFQNLHQTFWTLQKHQAIAPLSLYCDNGCSKYNVEDLENCMICWESFVLPSADAQETSGGDVNTKEIGGIGGYGGRGFLGLGSLQGAPWVERAAPIDFIVDRVAAKRDEL